MSSEGKGEGTGEIGAAKELHEKTAKSSGSENEEVLPVDPEATAAAAAPSSAKNKNTHKKLAFVHKELQSRSNFKSSASTGTELNAKKTQSRQNKHRAASSNTKNAIKEAEDSKDGNVEVVAFPKPVGRPKKRHVWDTARGIWVPDGGSKENETASSKPRPAAAVPDKPNKHRPLKKGKHSVAKQAATDDSKPTDRRSKKGRKVAPVATIHTKERVEGSLIYPKPAGRPKKGHQWNRHTGKWVPESLGDGSNVRKQSSVEPRPAPVEASSPTTHTRNTTRVPNDSRFLAPLNSPIQDEQGNYNRPIDRAPKGYVWDPNSGVWSRLGDEQDATSTHSLEAASNNSYNSAGLPPVRSKSKQSGTRRRHSTGSTHPKPRGRVPKGQVWDDKRGKWVPLETVPSGVARASLVNPSNRRPDATKSPARPSASARVTSPLVEVPEEMNKDDSKDPVSPPERRKGMWRKDTNKRSAEHKTGPSSIIDLDRTPKTPPKQTADGRYKKPPGRPPNNYFWDDTEGLWKSPDSENEDRTANTLRKSSLNAPKSANASSLSIDPTLSPKSAPKRTANGRYKRPRGKAPANCAWDDIKGVWKLAQGKKDARSSFDSGGSAKSPPRSRLSSKTAGTTARRMELAPKNAPHQTTDGLYKKPRGKPPLNYTWDATKGVWKLASVPKGHKESSATSFNVLNSAQGTRRGGTEAEASPGMIDLALAPRSPPKKGANGLFAKPRGRPPANCTWDGTNGVWRAAGGTKDTQDSFRIRSPSNMRLATTGSETDENGHKEAFSVGMTVAPKSVPEKTADGRYKKPRGPAPKNCMWDWRRGVWRGRQTNADGVKAKAMRFTSASGAKHNLSLKRSVNGSFKRPIGRAPAGCVWDADSGSWKLSQPTDSSQSRPVEASKPAAKRQKVTKLSSGTQTTTLLPYRSCGRCQNCRVTRNCGSCLACKNQGRDPCAPTCVLRVCVSPVPRSGPRESAPLVHEMVVDPKKGYDDHRDSDNDAESSNLLALSSPVDRGHDGIESLGSTDEDEEHMSDLEETQLTGADLARKVREADRAELDDDEASSSDDENEEITML